MVRFAATAIACVLIAGFGGGTALAKQCRDAGGKFTKCPTVAKPAPKQCRAANGKFVKCSSTKKM